MKLKATFVVPWQAYPLHSGGAIRAFHLASQLARNFETTAFYANGSDSIKFTMEEDFSNRDKQVSVSFIRPKSKTSILERLQNKLRTIIAFRNPWEPVNSLSCALRDAVDLSLSSNTPDAIVLTELESLLCARTIRQRSPSTKIFLDMHNVNHLLIKQRLESQVIAKRRHYDYYLSLSKERNLLTFVDHVFACSNEDLRVFKNISTSTIFHGSVIPNGVDTDQCKFDTSSGKRQKKSLIFCANLSTDANRDGLLWFHDTIWPLIQRNNKEVILNVIGEPPHNLPITISNDHSVHFAGRVEDLTPWYVNSSISICPLRIGSGTRLKVLEAMSYGTPIVSTTLGCEGLGAVPNRHLLIGDTPQSFALQVSSLLEDENQFQSIRHSARKYVCSNFDWNVIGEYMNQSIIDVIAGRI